MSQNNTPTCWIITDGKAGMESQCVGLAEAMHMQSHIKTVRLRKLWRYLGPYLNIGKRAAFSPKGDRLAPPWPDIVIASGRQSVLPSLYVKEATKGKSFHIQIQDPAFWYDRFDAIIVPEHDKLSGKNIITTKGALHRVTAARLQQEAAQWQSRFAHYPKPYVTLVLGGSNASYTLSPKEIMRFVPQLAENVKAMGGSLLVTPSRRTGDMNMALVRALLHDCPSYIWDGQGDNPYYAMLGAADWIVVTCDSVNMISEACSTVKPVYVVRLTGSSDKFNSFHQSLLPSGRIRFFDGPLEKWEPTALNEMERVAQTIQTVYDSSRRLVL